VQHVIVYIDFRKAFDVVSHPIVMLYSGVVQGSGIGPLMFLVCINELIDDLEKMLQSRCSVMMLKCI